MENLTESVRETLAGADSKPEALLALAELLRIEVGARNSDEPDDDGDQEDDDEAKEEDAGEA